MALERSVATLGVTANKLPGFIRELQLAPGVAMPSSAYTTHACEEPPVETQVNGEADVTAEQCGEQHRVFLQHVDSARLKADAGDHAGAATELAGARDTLKEFGLRVGAVCAELVAAGRYADAGVVAARGQELLQLLAQHKQ